MTYLVRYGPSYIKRVCFVEASTAKLAIEQTLKLENFSLNDFTEDFEVFEIHKPYTFKVETNLKYYETT